MSNNQNINQEILDLVDENTIILLNKIDLKQDNSIFDKFNNVLEISLKNSINLDKFINLLQEKLEKIVSPNLDTTITNERYRQELINSLKYLRLFNFKNPIEINAENIRMAGNCIGRITGKINSDEILDNIFSKFCIGK